MKTLFKDHTEPADSPRPDDDHGRRTFARRKRTYPEGTCKYCGEKLPAEFIKDHFEYCDQHCRSQWHWEILQDDLHASELAAIERKKASLLSSSKAI
jgi:hypothetical protein